MQKNLFIGTFPINGIILMLKEIKWNVTNNIYKYYW